MDVLVLIEGREAIPVRAIPLLTNWASMSPDIVAKVLAGDDGIFGFEGLQAYQRDEGVVRPIPAAWWLRFPVRTLNALSETLKSQHIGSEAQYVKWTDESLSLLPAGVFVWKDEYEALHESNWSARLRDKKHTAWLLNRCESRNEEVDDAEEPSSAQKIAMHRVDKEFEAWRALDFSPFIYLASHKNIVMEGFECQQANPQYQAAGVMPKFAYTQAAPAQTAPADTLAPVAKIGAAVGLSDSYVVEAPANKPGKTETVTHTTKTPRRDTLTPVIELAQIQCRNQKDTAEVWAHLLVLAESKNPPLLGATEDGLQYLKNGMAAIFKRDDLRKRLGR